MAVRRKFSRDKLNETKPGKLFYMVGLPRSGKSTFARKWAEDKEKRVIVNADSFRLAIHGQDYLQQAECVVHSSVEIAVRALLIEGFDVLVDETNTTKEKRERWRKMDAVAGFYMPTSKEECIKRTDPKNVELIKAIERMAQNLKNISIKDEKILIIKMKDKK